MRTPRRIGEIAQMKGGVCKWVIYQAQEGGTEKKYLCQSPINEAGLKRWGRTFTSTKKFAIGKGSRADTSMKVSWGVVPWGFI